jgi:tetratricopeptide (TPR) repeat protein
VADEPGQVVQGEQDAGAPADPMSRLKKDWRSYWQVPVLLVAAGVLLIGVAMSVGTTPEPDFSPVLDRAERMIEREQYEEAIAHLNSELYPWLGEEGQVSQLDRQRYHIAKARSIYFGQKKLGISDDRNHLSVVREYLEAERQGVVLAAKDVAALADTFLSRNDVDGAMRRLASLPPGSGAVRDPVLRRAVTMLLRPPLPDRERALQLLADVLADTETGIEQRVWALERQSDIRMDQGFIDETVTRLLREMPRLAEANNEGRGRLHLILAKAYRLLDADREAMRQVEHAEVLSSPADGHYPEILLERGRLELRAGEIAKARDDFQQVADKHANSESYAWAMVGLGETEAFLGSPELSIEAYQKLIDEYDTLGIEIEPTREQVMNSLLERADEALGAGDPGLAIRYGTMADRAVGGRNLPARVLETLAVSHERAAEELAEGATTKEDPLQGLDPSTRAEVQRHLMAAATNRRMHAERFVLTDIGRYADSLWRAADLFDRAGDQREAVQAFKIYAESMPSDVRYAEAKFRMAEALRAMGEFSASAEAYKDLIAEREGTAGVDIGAWADASHVPLAQAYLYDEDPANDATAEQLLLRAIDGTMAGTGTALFRDALVELAYVYDRTGRYERAIERLTEIAERYPKDREIGLVTYRLAEANRKLSGEIEASLAEALPATTRAEREQQVVNRREEAIVRYQQAIDQLSAMRAADRGRMEDLALRNAHFYIGDCLSDLGRYEEAIRAYDLARDRYGDDPATLVALVQIVNAHLALGDLRRARTANERAKRFYLSLPDAAWDDANLPMDRADWQAWLEASSKLLASAGTP